MELEIKYIPDAEFTAFIKGKGDKATWRGIDGHIRWVITDENGTEYIARPESAKP